MCCRSKTDLEHRKISNLGIFESGSALPKDWALLTNGNEKEYV